MLQFLEQNSGFLKKNKENYAFWQKKRGIYHRSFHCLSSNEIV
jgi:hypothetical protein